MALSVCKVAVFSALARSGFGVDAALKAGRVGAKLDLALNLDRAGVADFVGG